MTKEEIIRDVKATLGIDIEGVDVRGEIQQSLSNYAHPFKIYMLATSFGKSLTVSLSLNGKKCLIACSQLLHFDTWKNEAKKWNIDDSQWQYTSYDSLHKYKGQEFEILVLDEAQATSELRTDWIQEIRYKELIAASATIPHNVMQRLRTLGRPKVFKIDLQKAIEWGVLPEPTIKIVSCKLDSVNPNLVYTKGVDKKKKTVSCTYNQYLSTYKFNKQLRSKYNLKVTCTQVEYHNMLLFQIEDYDYILKQNGYRGVDHIFSMKKNIGARRKEFFAESKNSVVKKILEKHKNDRVVVFCNTKKQADLLSGKKYQAVHSDFKTEENQKTIDDFNAGITNKLFSVKQLNESVNLVDPDVCIITQLNGTDESKVSVANSQRLGRGIRAKDPLFYIPVYWNTRDHEYFNKFYETMDKDLFEFINEKDLC